ncbi:unnamed protein product [Chrysodeixis includens]|uniref:Uncharacterized protein n=1 Tax=Chrysodeixis includens TaxID=689277 RepID=A0A9P0FTQ9_CHRIL|nr:unnamed protein product [Chrysodeixis includens]
MCLTVQRAHDSYKLPKRFKTIIFVVLLLQIVFTSTVTINKRGDKDIEAKTRIELRSIFLPCFLNDVVRISAPMINEPTVYYLHKPNGETMKLNLGKPGLRRKTTEREVSPIVTKFVKNVRPIVTQTNDYDIFSTRKMSSFKFDAKVADMDPNEFMLGPLLIEDHGNWLLSAYTKDLDGEWVELFQVITITITEYLPANLRRPILHTGDTLHLSFAFPVNGLESCELVAPRSTFDRFFDRNLIEGDTCGYKVPNITMSDRGLWRIIGVGNIVYEAEVYLDVYKKL